MKQIFHAIHKQKRLCVACYTAITSLANTLDKFYIQSNLHTGYKHNFYDDKQEKIDKLFDQCHIPLLKHIYHPALIQEWIFFF